MLDRASTFAQPEIVELLKKEFVPVALDQAYQRRQQDTEGEFYRKIASQGPRHDFDSTTQGFYIANADGRLLLFNNNRDPEKLLRLMRQSLAELPGKDAANQKPTAALVAEKVDSRFHVSPPEGGMVVRVFAKVLDGYQPTDNPWERIFQTSLSRDNLWVTANEHAALVTGKFPASLQRRIVKYHLVDNTRGEPPMWDEDDIRELNVHLSKSKIIGTVRLENKTGDRGFDVQLKGEMEVVEDRIVRFDMVALGEFWGDGPYTKRAPVGKFPLAIAFRLADGADVADKIAPQGSRGWVEGYLQ